MAVPDKTPLKLSQIPTKNKLIVIDNYSPSFNYIVEDDKVYYSKKGNNNYWVDISENDKARENLYRFPNDKYDFRGYDDREKLIYGLIKEGKFDWTTFGKELPKQVVQLKPKLPPKKPTPTALQPKPKAKSSGNNWFVNAVIGASVAENPYAMMSAGWQLDSKGNWKQGNPPRSTMNDKLLRFKCGGVVKFQGSGKLPIGTQAQYNHVTEIYQSLVDKGVDPQAALDLVNQKVAEKGWTGYVTGDNRKYNNVSDFTDHLIDWHGRMYPNSLKVKNFDLFYEGINGTRELNDKARRTRGRNNSGRNYYNTEKGWDGYRKDLLKTRPGVRKRINYYRSLKGLSPLAYMNLSADNNINPIT